MKKLLKIIGGVILVIIVIGVISSMGKSGQNTSSNQTQTTNTNNQPEPTKSMAKVGEPVQDGDLAFTAVSVDTATTLGNQFTKKDAQRNVLYYYPKD